MGHGGTKSWGTLGKVTEESARRLGCQKRGQAYTHVCPCWENVTMWGQIILENLLYEGEGDFAGSQGSGPGVPSADGF